MTPDRSDTTTDTKFLTQNWEGFKKYATKAGIQRSENGNFISLLETLEEREVFLTPASTREAYVGCFWGSLVEHSMRTMSYMIKLKTAYGLDKVITTDSVVTVGLFHDVGKVGCLSTKEPYYLWNESDWHRSKLGQYFEVNPKLGFITPQQLSLKTLTDHSINLSLEEWYAISSLQSSQEDQQQRLWLKENEPPLAMVLKHAITASSRDMKNRKRVADLTQIGRENHTK